MIRFGRLISNNAISRLASRLVAAHSFFCDALPNDATEKLRDILRRSEFQPRDTEPEPSFWDKAWESFSSWAKELYDKYIGEFELNLPQLSKDSALSRFFASISEFLETTARAFWYCRWLFLAAIFVAIGFYAYRLLGGKRWNPRSKKSLSSMKTEKTEAPLPSVSELGLNMESLKIFRKILRRELANRYPIKHSTSDRSALKILPKDEKLTETYRTISKAYEEVTFAGEAFQSKTLESSLDDYRKEIREDA